MENYLFPGEHDMVWGFMIVMYPFLTGLVAGSFVSLTGSYSMAFFTTGILSMVALSLVLVLKRKMTEKKLAEIESSVAVEEKLSESQPLHLISRLRKIRKISRRRH